MSHIRTQLLVAVLLAATSGCASTLGRHEFLGPSFPARAADAPVEVFKSDPPTRAFIKIARLDVHLEKTGFVTSNLDNALPELKKQARAAGAEAIVEITETRSQHLETMMFHVTAYGIRYTDSK